MLALCSAGFAEELEDGLYTVGVTSSSSMFKIVKCVLRVEDGALTAVLTMSGQGYGYLYPGTAAEADATPRESWIPFEADFEGRKTFAVPIPGLDVDVDVAAWSIKYEKWYDRTLHFASNSLNPYVEIAPAGDYEGVLQSDTALDGVGALLVSDGQAMSVQLEVGKDIASVHIGDAVYAAENGELTFPLPSLDERLEVEVDGTVGWLQLMASGLAEHAMVPADGRYTIKVNADSGLFKVSECVLTVEEGQMRALLTVAKNSFEAIYPGSAAAALQDEAQRIPAVPDADGAYTYALPVAGLDVELPVATYAADRNRWYDRTLTFDSATLEPLS